MNNIEVNENWIECREMCKLQDEAWSTIQQSDITVAAIDNGLAFPFKHPDEWRACTFDWHSCTRRLCCLSSSSSSLSEFLAWSKK